MDTQNELVYFVTGVQFKSISSFKNKKYVSYVRNTHMAFKNNVVDFRTFGVFLDYSDAEMTVVSNLGDISEGGTFQYMVIEGIPPKRVYPTVKTQVCFELSPNKDLRKITYTKLDTLPQMLKLYFEETGIQPMCVTIG